MTDEEDKTDERRRARLCAELEILREEQIRQIPSRMIATAMRDGRGDYAQEIADAVGQTQLQAWEAGFGVAVRIAKHMGAWQVADGMERALADYWLSQGVDEED